MCLVTLAIDQSRRYPLMVAASHAIFSNDASRALSWWSPGLGQPTILSARDQATGGVWLGLNGQGRLAVLTRIQTQDLPEPQAPSRGGIAAQWLSGQTSLDRFWMQIALSGYQGFNLMAADFSLGELIWASNLSGQTTRLERGLYDMGTTIQEGPQAEEVSMKAYLADRLQAELELDELIDSLFSAMNPAHALTVIVTERFKKRLLTHVVERRPGSPATAVARFVLKDWPPRYTMSAQHVVELEQPSALLRASSKTRVRSLLRPDVAIPKLLLGADQAWA